MRLLILGGTGFLGRELVACALEEGHEVTCLARGTQGPPDSAAAFVQADRTRAGAYDEVATRPWDCVIDLTWDPGCAEGALTALAPRARHWIFVSTVSVYARHDHAGADETAEILAPDFARGPGIERYGEAKAACEELCRRHLGDRLLIARAGLIGGPGDGSGRSGYWVARCARNPLSPLLVPDTPEASTQVVDVRDLAQWLIACAETRVTGTFDAVGPPVPFAEWVDLCRHVGGHTGEVRAADVDWLLAHDVAIFMGPRSMAMWVDERGDYRGWSRRSGTRAESAGLAHRPREAVVTDLLAWETAEGLDRPRGAGLTAEEEAELLGLLRS